MSKTKQWAENTGFEQKVDNIIVSKLTSGDITRSDVQNSNYES